jgi:outer membrane protein
MKGLVALTALAAVIAGAATYADAAPPLPQVRIAVVADGPWERNREMKELLEKSISDVLGKDAPVSIDPGKVLVGDWTLAGVRIINDRLLVDPDVDMILGMGVIASQDLATRGPLPKPVIAPVVVDVVRQHIPMVNGASGVKNLSYLVYPQTFVRDLELFREVVPIRKLVNISSRPYDRVLPSGPEPLDRIGERLGLTIVQLFVDSSADEVLKNLPRDADAVFIEPIPQLPTKEFDRLIQAFIEFRLPSFSFFSDTEVRRGVLASANPDILPRLARRIALNVQRIVGEREEPATLPVAFTPGKRLAINLNTAEAIGVSPRWDLLLEAELVGSDSTLPGAYTFTLPEAIRRISERNLDIRARIREVRAEGLNTAIARSVLFPKIDVNVTGVQIDGDRAVAGGQPERSATFEASGSQVIFAEAALANLSIQSSLQDARTQEMEAGKLNTIVEGAQYYLNYLRIRRMYYLLLDNLRLTRTNLELARVRQTTGAASPEESLRWEMEIASLRKTTMDMHSQMNQALLALKQILAIPMLNQVNVVDVPIFDTTMFIANKDVLACLDEPVGFGFLSDFLVSEASQLSPELRQLDAVIEAENRNLTSLRLNSFLPTISAFGSYSHRFASSEIVSPFRLPSLTSAPAPGTPGEAFLYNVLGSLSPALPDDKNWSVGIQLSLNLFSGMGTSAALEKSAIHAEQYAMQRQSVSEKVELRIRTEMEHAKASKFAMDQATHEQNAARKTLDIVTDSYSRGAVSILSLLDAQNGALRADQVAANALYDFWISSLLLQRAIGQFTVLMTPQERGDFLNRLNNKIAPLKKR